MRMYSDILLALRQTMTTSSCSIRTASSSTVLSTSVSAALICQQALRFDLVHKAHREERQPPCLTPAVMQMGQARVTQAWGSGGKGGVYVVALRTLICDLNASLCLRLPAVACRSGSVCLLRFR